MEQFTNSREALRIYVYYLCYLTVTLQPNSLCAASTQYKQTPVLAALTVVLLEAI